MPREKLAFLCCVADLCHVQNEAAEAAAVSGAGSRPRRRPQQKVVSDQRRKKEEVRKEGKRTRGKK